MTLPENQQSAVEIEVSNPSVKGNAGAAKAFAFSWWAGALTALLDKEMEAKDVFYSEQKNVMRCQILPR